MKPSYEISGSSVDSLKRKATSLKRVAGGIRTEIESANTTSLSEKELCTLKDAVELLEKLSVRFSIAKTNKQRAQEKLAQLVVVVRKKFTDNFLTLSSVEDRVAFIAAAAYSYVLREAGWINTRKDLDSYFFDAIDSLARNFAHQVENGAVIDEIVEKAWQKFLEGSGELKRKYRNEIDKLTLAEPEKTEALQELAGLTKRVEVLETEQFGKK